MVLSAILDRSTQPTARCRSHGGRRALVNATDADTTAAVATMIRFDFELAQNQDRLCIDVEEVTDAD